MIWIILMPLAWIVTALAMLTTPIAVLFADKNGEMTGFWKYWQTFDSSIDAGWFIKQKMPVFLQYDFDKYYTEKTISVTLKGVLQEKYTVIQKTELTFKDKIKRYFCRVAWLWRNRAYGFDYYWFGRTIQPGQVKEKAIGKVGYIRYSTKGNLINKAWTVYVDWHYCRLFYLSLYIGWKLPQVGIKIPDRVMIATRINPVKPSKEG